MPRHLHPNGVPEFLAHYGVEDRCGSCQSGNLGVTVWDHYGTMPADGSPEAEAGTGTFVSAVVACGDCGHGLMLDRATLAAKQAAE